MINSIRALFRRIRCSLFVPCRPRTQTQRQTQRQADERNLRAEGYYIVTTRCRRCGADERAAIFPENVLKPSECGKCHHMKAEVTEIVP